MSNYPDWLKDRFGNDIPYWAEERWGDDADEQSLISQALLLCLSSYIFECLTVFRIIVLV